MVNKNIFSDSNDIFAVSINDAGGIAYSRNNLETLSQLILTGTFNNTFYVSGKTQFDRINSLLKNLSKEDIKFIAKLAIYARKHGFMKDTPAFLTAWLSKNGPEYLDTVFNSVINNGKMLRNLVQIIRSGKVGRKSFGSHLKRLIQNWIIESDQSKIISGCIGKKPSMADILKMIHPRPKSLEQNSLFKWILGVDMVSEEVEKLPQEIINLIRFRLNENTEIPNVPFELLTSQELSEENWKAIAKQSGWHMIRMNLNTFLRKGIFKDIEITNLIAKRLSDPQEIYKAKILPYQIFTTWMNISNEIPLIIKKSLEKALEYSIQTVPIFEGKTLIFVDVSGSMISPITGRRKGSTSKMRCVDVASLIASSFLKVNPNNVEIVLFDTKIYRTKLNPENSVMENAEFLSSIGGGGTACQLPLIEEVNNKTRSNLIIYISDNESWFNLSGYYFNSEENWKPQVVKAWKDFKIINPKAKMVCIDLQPNTTVQVRSYSDVLNIGGFSDVVYDVITDFINNNSSKDFWINRIKSSIDF